MRRCSNRRVRGSEELLVEGRNDLGRELEID